MSEDYNYACERAELLGLPIPSLEEWTESQKAQEADRADHEDDDAILQVLCLFLLIFLSIFILNLSILIINSS